MKGAGVVVEVVVTPGAPGFTGVAGVEGPGDGGGTTYTWSNHLYLFI